MTTPATPSVDVSDLPFGPCGPFDLAEREAIGDLVRAVRHAALPGSETWIEAAKRQMELLERLGALIDGYASLYDEQSLGKRKRSFESLVERLAAASLSNFEMFVPTKALLGRDLNMAELNFYRLLRLICNEALPEERTDAHRRRIDELLCHCVYIRLAEEALRHIAADETVAPTLRHRAVVALVQLWDLNTVRMDDVFPTLAATWEARRRVPAVLGTLVGTAEVFGLIREGCDPAFVDYLSRPDQPPEMIDAFREFLFGASTEDLKALDARRLERGAPCVSRGDTGVCDIVKDAVAEAEGDPAGAMFEFFLSRHLKAESRRLAGLSGPQRTAEEYVLLYYLESEADGD